MLHVSTQTAMSSTAQHSTAKWLTIDQIGKKLDGQDGTLQDVSAYHSFRFFNICMPLSSARAPYLTSLTQ